MMNVAELVLAQVDLRAGGSGFAALLCAYGAGLVAGSLLGAGGRDLASLRRRYLASLALLAAGLLGSATVAALPAALASFAVTGAGNGLFVVSDRILLQRAVAERFHGRAFGLLDAFGAWGFAGATLAGGALVAVAGARVTFAVAGAGALAVLLIAARVLADRRSPHAVAPVLNPQMSLNADPRGARDGLEVVTVP